MEPFALLGCTSAAYGPGFDQSFGVDQEHGATIRTDGIKDQFENPRKEFVGIGHQADFAAGLINHIQTGEPFL